MQAFVYGRAPGPAAPATSNNQQPAPSRQSVHRSEASCSRITKRRDGGLTATPLRIRGAPQLVNRAVSQADPCIAQRAQRASKRKVCCYVLRRVGAACGTSAASASCAVRTRNQAWTREGSSSPRTLFGQVGYAHKVTAIFDKPTRNADTVARTGTKAIECVAEIARERRWLGRRVFQFSTPWPAYPDLDLDDNMRNLGPSRTPYSVTYLSLTRSMKSARRDFAMRTLHAADGASADSIDSSEEETTNGHRPRGAS